MTDHVPSRLELLRFLHRVQEQQLAQTRQWIEREEEHSAEVASRLPLPDPPGWFLERGISARRKPVAVHSWGCRIAGKLRMPLTREQAVEAVTVQQIRPCELCRPDAELGLS